MPIIVDDNTHAWLLENPGVELSIDVDGATLTLPDDTPVSFQIDAFAKHCLVEGVDQLGFLQQQQEQIREFEETRNWKP